MMKKLYPIILVVLFSISLAQIPFNANSMFVVKELTWGTSTTPLEVGPGDKNVALTVSFLYQGSYTVTKLRAELNLPSGFTDTGGSGIATVYAVNIAKNTMFSLTFNLNIDANASLATYAMSLHFVFDTIVSTDSEQTITVNVPLKGKSKLTFEAPDIYLNPGQTNELTVTLSNTGTGNVSDVTISVSAPSSVSVLTKLPTISSLSASSSTTFNVSLYVSSTAANSPVSVTFSASYIDAYLNSRSASEALGFIVKPVDQSLFAISASPTTLTIGQTNQVKITLENTGVVSLKNTSIIVSAQSPITLLDSDGKFSLGTIITGDSSDFNINLYVSSTTTTTASISLSISYIDQTGTQKTETRTVNFFITSLITFFKVSSSTETLYSGEEEPISITVQNKGSATLKDIYVTLSAQSPLNLVGTDGKFSLGTLGPSETKDFSVTIYVSSTSSFSGSLQLAFSYTDPAEATKSETRTLTFLLNLRQVISPISLNVQPASLTAGKANNVTVSVKNIADYSLHSISLSFAFSGGSVTWLQPDIAQAEELGSGQSFVIQARAYDPPTTTASVTLQISIKYYDSSNVLFQETRNIGLLSQGMIDIKVTDFSVIPEQITPGRIFSITGTITNIGTITASAVTATPHLPEGFIMFGSRSVFIGDMQVNTPTTFTLSIQATNATKPNSYQIPVELSYNDNLRNPLSTTLSVPVDIQEKTTTTTTTTGTTTSSWGIMSISPYIIVAAIALATGYLIGKRVKKQ